MKKKSYNARVKETWKVFSEYIRRRDNGKCFTCGTINRWQDTNAGHFKHGVLDFDEENISCQCVQCNKWNHGRLDRYADNLREKLGPERYEALKIRASLAKKGRKYNDWELESIKTEYEAKIHELENGPIKIKKVNE